MHLNVGDYVSWYRNKYPGFKVGTIVPGLCFTCWVDLKQGDEVEISDWNPHTRPKERGKRGILKEILDAPEHGKLYLVEVEGVENYFIRPELKKIENQK